MHVQNTNEKGFRRGNKSHRAKTWPRVYRFPAVSDFDIFKRSECEGF